MENTNPNPMPEKLISWLDIARGVGEVVVEIVMNRIRPPKPEPARPRLRHVVEHGNVHRYYPIPEEQQEDMEEWHRKSGW